MSKKSILSNPAFQQKAETSAIGFNLVTQSNSFNSMFETKPLEQAEVLAIEKLLTNNIQLALVADYQIEKDVEEIKALTAEIKAIAKQGIILMGERVYKAREILKSYINGTFTKWLEVTFGSRKTGYNLLAYYELYHKLPDLELKEKFKKIPQKAAYILASREGDIEKKLEIIGNYHGLSAQELIFLIQESLPLIPRNRKIRKKHTKIISYFYEAIHKLKKYKEQLSIEDKEDLVKLRSTIDYILT